MRRQRGTSLVELMVGLLVGLLVALSATAMGMFFEGAKRSALGSGTAVEDAALAVSAIQRDARMAGLGLVLDGVLACPTTNIYYNGVRADGQSIPPVSIVNDENGNADSITFLSAASVLGASANRLQTGMATADADLVVNQSPGLVPSAMLLVSAPNTAVPCTAMQVSAATPVSGTANMSLAHAGGSWNPGDPAGTFAIPGIFQAGSPVLAAGGLNWTTYRVRGNTLEAYDNLAQTTVVLVDNVVALRAQYGATDGVNPTISQWVDATGAWAAPLDAAHVTAIRAVRFAIVVRAPQKEKPDPGTGQCTLTTAPIAAWLGGPAIDLSATPDWACYRYRAFSTVAPLKNLAWRGV